jgi:asparagine synthase (glutamine-hydrolysing)
MCGIAGVLSWHRERVRPAVQAMMRAMLHRGPDDEGYDESPLMAGRAVEEPTCGFGFRRLSILDLSPAGHQPMTNPDTGDRLIFNGEIYNFRSLRTELESRGVRFRSSGDTEVLLQALSVWGEATLDRLDGMFAFAFHHAASGRVLLARDPLGIKPLYVAHVKNTLVFASEIRTVLASGLVPDDLDPAGIAAYFAYGSPQDPLTIHRHIRSLPAGACAWIDRSSVEAGQTAARRYWSFPTPQPTGEADAAGLMQSDIASAVADQCVSDVPLGVFLSGGIDSAVLAGFAHAGNANLSTFSVGFEGVGVEDELSDAAATAKAIGTHHFQTVLDADWIQSQWQQWLKAADRPSIDGLNMYIVSGSVSDLGTKVALSGLGADEIFGGYSHFRTVPALLRYARLFALVPRTLRIAAGRLAFAPFRRSRRKRAISLLAAEPSILGILLSIRRLLDDDDLQTLGLSPRSLGLRPDFLPQQAIDHLALDRLDPFHTLSRVECGLYMNNTLLRDADVNSMAHSIEVRVPFLSRPVVEHAFRLPTDVLAPPNSPPKHLLREAAASTLPRFIFDRPKKGFSLPIGDWMFGPLRDECEAAIDTVAACPILPERGVRRLWDDFRRGGNTVHWTKPLLLVALGSYLRKHCFSRS